MFEKRSLGISFEADGGVKAVELVSGVRTVALVKTLAVPAEGADVFDSWHGAVENLGRSGFDADGAVIGIPDSLVYRKQLSFPFSSRKRIMQILDSELDGEIPLPVDNVVADFVAGQSTGPGITGTAIACDRNILSRFLDIFGQGARLRGVQTTVVGLTALTAKAGVSEGIAISCTPGEALLIEVRAGRVKTVKRISLTGEEERDIDLLVVEIRGHTVDGDEIILDGEGLSDGVRDALAGEDALRLRSVSDLEVVQAPAGAERDMNGFGTAAGLALGGLGVGETASFDLRQGPFRQVTAFSGMKGPLVRTSVLFAAVVILAFAGLIADIAQSRGAYHALQNQIEKEFTELFPGSRHQPGQETAHILGELTKLQKRVADMSGLEGRGALSILSELSEAVPSDVSIKFDELSYDSKKLRFEGSVSSFDAVDRIKAALEEDHRFSEVQVQNARVGASINKVTFRMQMEVR